MSHPCAGGGQGGISRQFLRVGQIPRDFRGWVEKVRSEEKKRRNFDGEGTSRKIMAAIDGTLLTAPVSPISEALVFSIAWHARFRLLAQVLVAAYLFPGPMRDSPNHYGG
jgi:hypothetical protein